jgi:hypothetical protein
MSKGEGHTPNSKFVLQALEAVFADYQLRASKLGSRLKAVVA